MLGKLHCNVMLENPTMFVVPLLPHKHWETFGSWLRKMRRAADLSQAEVARRAHISENQVARIEKGESGTRRETVIALARAIGINLADALKQAGYALPDEKAVAELNEKFYPSQMPPKTYTQLLYALEALGIEIDWATMGSNLENYTEDDFADLLDRIKLDTDFSVRRKAK